MFSLPKFNHRLNYYLLLQVDRAIKNVTVLEQKEKKDFSFQENILHLCLECLEKETVPANGALFSLACTSSVRQLSSKARKTKGSLMSPPFLNKTNQPIFSFLREPES